MYTPNHNLNTGATNHYFHSTSLMLLWPLKTGLIWINSLQTIKRTRAGVQRAPKGMVREMEHWPLPWQASKGAEGRVTSTRPVHFEKYFNEKFIICVSKCCWSNRFSPFSTNSLLVHAWCALLLKYNTFLQCIIQYVLVCTHAFVCINLQCISVLSLHCVIELVFFSALVTWFCPD